MRDNIRKHRAGHPAPALLIGLLLTVGQGLPARAAARTGPCDVSHATLGETDQPTPEISTDQLDSMLAKKSRLGGILILDVRPYDEFAISHIPGALTVGAKPGLPMSQYTSDVGEIGKLVNGNVDAPIILYCNGPFCGKSKRVAADLRNAGYTHVVRYQLGIPVWRALGHPTQSEGEAIRATLDKDQTAVVIDAREPAAFQAGSLPRARNVRFEEVVKAKDDGRLPMLDHNTRIFVVGKDGLQAMATAQEIARNAFQNVSYFAGAVDSLMQIRP